jgi:hypothetical protein
VVERTGKDELRVSALVGRARFYIVSGIVANKFLQRANC